jgi:hypothetical protein
MGGTASRADVLTHIPKAAWLSADQGHGEKVVEVMSSDSINRVEALKEHNAKRGSNPDICRRLRIIAESKSLKSTESQPRAAVLNGKRGGSR